VWLSKRFKEQLRKRHREKAAAPALGRNAAIAMGLTKVARVFPKPRNLI